MPPAAALDQIAPATPEWRVHDVLAHLVGVTDDVVNGRLDGIASDPWTAAQVDARRDRSVAELLAEWDERRAAVRDGARRRAARVGGQALFDAATHEHDLRHALGAPGARDCDAVAIAFEFCTDVAHCARASRAPHRHRAGDDGLRHGRARRHGHGHAVRASSAP